MCRVTILNENGIPVTVEVSREIYQVFVDYEREIERQRKADFRHRDARSWDTCLIFEVSTETLEQTYERIRTLHEIQEALNEFTPKQRRRFLLHFAYGYTYMLIQTSAPMALQNIWRIMEYEKSNGRMARTLCSMLI